MMVGTDCWHSGQVVVVSDVVALAVVVSTGVVVVSCVEPDPQDRVTGLTVPRTSRSPSPADGGGSCGAGGAS